MGLSGGFQDKGVGDHKAFHELLEVSIKAFSPFVFARNRTSVEAFGYDFGDMRTIHFWHYYRLDFFMGPKRGQTIEGLVVLDRLEVIERIVAIERLVTIGRLVAIGRPNERKRLTATTKKSLRIDFKNVAKR